MVAAAMHSSAMGPSTCNVRGWGMKCCKYSRSCQNIVDPGKARKHAVCVKRRCALLMGFRNLSTRLSCAPTGKDMVPPLSRRPPLNREKSIATNEDENDNNSNEIPGSISIEDRVFYDVSALFQFFGSLLTRTELGNRVPNEDAKLLLSLLIKGHATPKEKIGCGVRYIYADKHPDYGQKCFMLMRKDGSSVDFSYRKCINNIGGSGRKVDSRKSPSRSPNDSPNQSPGHRSFKPQGPKNCKNELIALCKQILFSSPVGAHLSEAQNRVFFTMISKGHPNAEEKLGSGIEYVLVSEHPDYGTKCFMLKRFDGDSVDFSFKKCINSLPLNVVDSLLGRMSATISTASDSNTKGANVWDEVAKTIKDALEYTPVGVRVEEKTEKMLLDILVKGHKEADQKIGCGVDYVFVDLHPSCHKSFFLMRKDGTTDDFSFMKCINRIRKDENLKVRHGLREPVMKMDSLVFASGDQMYWHFSSILNSYPNGGRIADDHSKLVIELLAQGHPNAENKIGCGVDYIMVQLHEKFNQKCFWVVRKDGSSEDFSYRKCVSNILEKKGAEDPRKLMQLRDSAKDLSQEKLNNEAGGEEDKSSFRTTAEAIAESILDFVGKRNTPSYMDSVVLSGLAYCMMISEETILPLIKEHKSLSLMMQRLDRSRETDSAFAIYKRVCDLSLFSTATKETWEVYTKDLASIIEVAPELPFPVLFTLLSRISMHSNPESINMEQLVSVLKSKLAADETPISCKAVDRLIQSLLDLNVAPGRFIFESKITVLQPPHNTGVVPARVLRRLQSAEEYPGPEFVNQIVHLFLTSSHVDFGLLTHFWAIIVNIRHKLPYDLLQKLLQLAEKLQRKTTAPHLATWIWGLGHQGLNVPIYDVWIQKLSLMLQDNPQSLDPRNIAVCLWSMAVLRKYELPEFKLLWSLINQVPVEDLGKHTLASIYQVSVAVELECPDVQLRLSNAMYNAAADTWRGAVQQVTISPIHLDVFQRLKTMGFKAAIEYVTSRHLFSVDIVLLPPAYPVTNGVESGFYEDSKSNLDLSHTEDEFLPHPIDPTPAFPDDDTSLSDTSIFADPCSPIKFIEHSIDATAPELLGPPSLHPDLKSKVLAKAKTSEDKDGGETIQGNGVQPNSESSDSEFMDTDIKWLFDVEMPEALARVSDSNTFLNSIKEGCSELDDMDIADGPTDSEINASIEDQTDEKLRVQTSTFISAPKDQLNLEAALEFDKLPLVAIEVNGTSHYFRNCRHPLGRSILRDRLMRKLGWRIVPIFTKKWARLDPSGQKQYILSLMETAGIDYERFLDSQ